MLSRLWLFALVPLTFLAGCNNTLNPLCGSARPKPLIASLSPSTVKFSDVQNNGVLLSVNGSQFVPASELVIGLPEVPVIKPAIALPEAPSHRFFDRTNLWLHMSVVAGETSDLMNPAGFSAIIL